MSAFVVSLSEWFALLFQSFRLSALLPAAIFVFGNAVLVFPAFKSTFVGKLYYDGEGGSQTLALLTLTLTVTYFLNTINYSVIRWLEGYPLQSWNLRWISSHQEAHRQRLLNLQAQLPKLESKIPNLDSSTDEYQRAITEYHTVITELTMYYPSTVDRVTLTRFGNVIASAEDYPNKLYKIDSVALWPLLVPILTQTGYAKFIQREKSTLDFLLNAMLITSALGLEVIIVSVANVQSHIALMVFVATVITFLMLYNLSIDAAMNWGLTIRTAFDLYRDALRKALRIKQPKRYLQEQDYWEKASQFYGKEREYFGLEIFDYADKAFATPPTADESGNQDKK